MLAFPFVGVAAGQIPGGSSARDIDTPILKVTVDQVIERANDHFRKGKMDLQDNEREQARDEFDKALDEILTSGLDVRASKRLETFYLELVERIYREESPLKPDQKSKPVQPKQSQVGFRQQGFDPSPLDALSKLVLTDEAELRSSEQKPCTLGIEKAPAIRGIRLGMTVSEVRAIHPTIAESNTRDTANISMKYSAVRGKPDKTLNGIASLFLDFFQGRLWMITVFYEHNNAQEIEPILTVLSLPKEAGSRAICQGFEAKLDQIFTQVEWEVSLMDTAAAEKRAALAVEKSIALEEKKGNAQCERSPVIRGVKLGMTSTQFKTLYPHARIVSKRTEVGELVFRSLGGDDARLQGIGTLWTYFLDGKVYFMVVDYSSKIEWKSLDQFVEQFSKRTGLRKKWDVALSDRTLRCSDFTVQAKWSAGHPRVLISDRSEVLKLTKREERSKSPASFRP